MKELNRLQKIEGVIFDLDGLVLNTEDSYRFAWRQAAQSMGYRVPEPFLRCLAGLDGGDVRRKFSEYLGDGFELKKFMRLSTEYWYKHVQEIGIPVQRGVYDLLSLLETKGIPYCLATNSCRASALECLGFGGLGNVFDVIVARDDVRLGKPAPDVFLLASERLAVRINRCLALDDSLPGVAGAAAAGAFTVLVSSTLPIDRSAILLSDWQCRDLDHVSEWLSESCLTTTTEES